MVISRSPILWNSGMTRQIAIRVAMDIFKNKNWKGIKDTSIHNKVKGNETLLKIKIGNVLRILPFTTRLKE